MPEIWVGGSSKRAIRRARELGDVVASRRAARTSTTCGGEGASSPSCASSRARGLTRVDAMLEAGAEGVVVTFADEVEMRAFPERYR